MAAIVTAVETSSPGITAAYATIDRSGTSRYLRLIVSVSGEQVTAEVGKAALTAVYPLFPADLDRIKLTFSTEGSDAALVIETAMRDLGFPAEDVISDGRVALVERPWLEGFAGSGR
ncbi:hypothetical protein E3O44_18700 [Cryobacterium algoricola]|uniref:Uncharacterized protein n=1 Tax=Cryobacterium algoricola TaxID=1259183 RepID=A0ABY2I790_9MICO|nr:hypothetical protein [Cryobacterium algoricola]TFB83202.1 hypothetical protein E3O44_18700 [Cryobacterium algoricola]